MSPGSLDVPATQAKLRTMRELLDDLDGLGEVDPDRLVDDRLLRHAVERILIALIDLAVAINSHLVAVALGQGPADYRQSFRLAAEIGVLPPELADALAPSVGLRDIRVHDYLEVDLEIVARSVDGARRSYGDYVTTAARQLVQNP